MADDARDAVNRLLPWQRPVWEQVWQLRQTERLPHALLLCGIAGMGKDHFARLLGHALLCEATTEEGLPCGTCRSCLLTLAGTHPDLHRCEPEEDKTFINVDQIREIGRFLELKSHYGRHKIVVITPAERMNVNAANALLKLLEEPPAGTHLLLVSSRPAALAATVRSRCQRLFFTLRDERPALDWLSSMPSEDVQRDPVALLALAQGAPLTAVAMAEHGHLGHRQDRLGELLALVRHQADPLQVAENWLKFDAKAALYWLHGWLLDMIRFKASDRPPYVGNPDSRDILLQLSSGLKTPWLFEQLDRSTEALRLLDGAVNTQLLLEDTLLPWTGQGATASEKLLDVN
jgi:DNA polymerase-3 subunit delta'